MIINWRLPQRDRGKWRQLVETATLQSGACLCALPGKAVPEMTYDVSFSLSRDDDDDWCPRISVMYCFLAV